MERKPRRKRPRCNFSSFSTAFRLILSEFGLNLVIILMTVRGSVNSTVVPPAAVGVTKSFGLMFRGMAAAPKSYLLRPRTMLKVDPNRPEMELWDERMNLVAFAFRSRYTQFYSMNVSVVAGRRQDNPQSPSQRDFRGDF